ncbi:16S rRNA (cytosine(967)-C(5))-methyltransferase RsmB [Staphylococcus massiliensis]|uniref:16S rRNA (cytosine(967)-C(5))-methyltransferase RsmB n=1 Tax=Staphylococcus massiliensis TaxID=555791 RepID=UPI001EE0CF16|nr:16S rRNA (cytosine(967)-C(5))-methyltransferase RsmB [Staphylococcus massiliensis]MCG3401375.1 16S rRNA (cytosine(967)-C(5))-methyltransferase RsmB [Staphylococcus massiliensis]
MTTARQLAYDTLEKIETEGAYSNLIINDVLNEHHLSSSDRGLYTELVYGTLARRYALDYFLKPHVNTRIKRWVRQLLWMSIYQYVYLNKIPNHAIINEAVEIAKARGGRHQGNVVNAILRSLMNHELASFDEIKDPKKRISIEYSIPLWIIEHWTTHHGLDQTRDIAKAMLQSAPQTVRVNETRITPSEAKAQLETEGYQVETCDELPECLHVSGKPIMTSGLFKAGKVSIQDKSSMFVANVLQSKTGDAILDTCSAPGGKACHIGEKLNQTGHVLASDVHAHKMKLIEHNVKKLGLKNIEAIQHDATQPYNQTFDKILVDAPCSGLGVMRHKPEIKYRETKDSVLSLVDIQLDILTNASKHLKPGGTLVYSTCTIEQMENENVIYTFLKQNPEFEFLPFEDFKSGEPVKTLQILPQDFNSDGFFITRIKRKET